MPLVIENLPITDLKKAFREYSKRNEVPDYRLRDEWIKFWTIVYVNFDPSVKLVKPKRAPLTTSNQTTTPEKETKL